MSVTARINLAPFRELTERLSAPINWDVTVKLVRVLLASETKRNFDQGASPDGQPWRPLKRPRKAGRTGEKPLRDTGLLMASVSAQEATASAIRESKPGQAGPVIVHGTNVSYAKYHQHGTRTIPARPFLGINQRIAQRVALIVQEQVERQLKASLASLGGKR